MMAVMMIILFGTVLPVKEQRNESESYVCKYVRNVCIGTGKLEDKANTPHGKSES